MLATKFGSVVDMPFVMCYRAAFSSATRRSIHSTRPSFDDSEKKFPDLMATLDEKPPQKIVDLAKQILSLNMLESKDLMDILKKELGIPDGASMPMGMPGMGYPMAGAPGQAAPGAPAAAAAEAAPAQEKTDFELKLESFNAADKLKVIKEIRAITGLGLKESKDMVEKVPSVLLAKVTKADGEKFIKQIGDAGGKAVLA
eukprot:760412-Hanusia_phi.AAC.3